MGGRAEMEEPHPRNGVDRIRLAVVNVSPLVEGIVTELMREVPFVEVVDRLGTSLDLRTDFERSGADVLLYSLPEEEMHRLWKGLIADRPSPLAVFNLVDDDRRARFYALHPMESTVEELTAASLLDALRSLLTR
jgi:hypothetical protein